MTAQSLKPNPENQQLESSKIRTQDCQTLQVVTSENLIECQVVHAYTEWYHGFKGLLPDQENLWTTLTLGGNRQEQRYMRKSKLKSYSSLALMI